MTSSQLIADSQRAATRVAFISPRAAVRQSGATILRDAGYEVLEVADLDAARSWIEDGHANLLLVLDVGSDDEDAFSDALSLAREVAGCQPRSRLILVSQAEGTRAFELVLQRYPTKNFLGFKEGDSVEERDLTLTVAKILTGEIFGLEPYLGDGAEIEARRLRRSDDKPNLVELVEEFAQQAGCGPQIVQNLGLASDELITNALYNAPVDADGARRFAKLDRSVPVVLGDDEDVEIKLGFDGKRLGIAVSDPFGSLRTEDVVAQIARCYERRDEDDQVNLGPGGAGLGLYYFFNVVQHLVINVDPGKRTEFIGLLEATRSFRRFSKRRKSFNLFDRQGPE